jgi:NAD(P)-dependent dehydrogenase (short-subunit alcohol dehydrogenase family)
MSRKTILITGANSGLGYFCAKTILSTNPTFHVILANRDEQRTLTAINSLKSETNNPNISFLQIDLSSLSSVRSAASQLSTFPVLPLQGLVLNAGIGPGAPEISEPSPDGFDKIWATNHLGHFAFANLIRSHLAPDCRIAVVSSNLHNIPPERVNGVRISYPGAEALAKPDLNAVSPMMRYSQSKLCNLYFTYELVRRIGDSEMKVNAFNPGLMLDSEFHKTKMPPRPNVVSCVDMGRELADLTIGEKWKGINGRYVNRGVDEPSSELSHNEENGKELWEGSQRLAELDSTF